MSSNKDRYYSSLRRLDIETRAALSVNQYFSDHVVDALRQRSPESNAIIKGAYASYISGSSNLTGSEARLQAYSQLGRVVEAILVLEKREHDLTGVVVKAPPPEERGWRDGLSGQGPRDNDPVYIAEYMSARRLSTPSAKDMRPL